MKGTGDLCVISDNCTSVYNDLNGNFNFKNVFWGIPWRSSGEDSALSLPRVQVRSLVGN